MFKLEVKNILKYLSGALLNVIIIAILSILTAILTMIQPKLIGNIISDPTYLLSPNMKYFSLIMIGTLVLSSIKEYIAELVAENMAVKARERIYNKLIYTKMDDISNYSPGEIISIISADTRLIRDIIGNNFFDFIGSFVLLIGSIAFLVRINAVLFLYTAVLVCNLILFNIIFSIFLKKYTIQQQEKISNFISSAESYLSKLIVIKSFWLVDFSKKKFKEESFNVYKSGKNLAKIRAIVSPINNLIVQFGVLIIMLIAGVMVSKGEINLSEFAQFFLYLTLLISPVSIIANSFASIGMLMAAESRINLFCLKLSLSEYPEIRECESKYAGNNIIKVDNISFNYEENKTVFNNFSVDIYKNTITAIMGESGVGKSTLAKLLNRLYDISSGNIYFYNTDIKDIPVNYLREKIICYNPQENLEWGDTIYESLCLDKKIPISDIDFWIDKLNLTKFLNTLSEGINTSIGFVLSKASVGELQRLSLIRALLTNTEVLVLDEPTANLDEENEQIVYEVLKEVAKKRTVIVITHKENIKKITKNVVEIKRGELK